MTIPRMSVINPSARKQSTPADSFKEQQRRDADLQSDLLRIVGAMGMSRSLLQARSPWDNASRDPREYAPNRPHARLQTMIRDVVKTVADRGKDSERTAVRNAVTTFYETLQRDALEFLGDEPAGSVLALTTESNKEVSEAVNATITAIASKCPQDHATAGREVGESLTVLSRLKDALHHGSRRQTFQVVR